VQLVLLVPISHHVNQVRVGDWFFLLWPCAKFWIIFIFPYSSWHYICMYVNTCCISSHFEVRIRPRSTLGIASKKSPYIQLSAPMKERIDYLFKEKLCRPARPAAAPRHAWSKWSKNKLFGSGSSSTYTNALWAPGQVRDRLPRSQWWQSRAPLSRKDELRNWKW